MPVWVHPDDRRLAAHPYRYRPQQNRFAFPLRHPRSWPILGAMTAAGALTVRGVQADQTYADNEVLPVPGRPRAVHTPGHTWGQSVFHLPDRDVLLSGDALVTLDPYTGLRGPRLVAPAATSDTRQAYAALDRIERLEARWSCRAMAIPGWRAPARPSRRPARLPNPDSPLSRRPIRSDRPRPVSPRTRIPSRCIKTGSDGSTGVSERPRRVARDAQRSWSARAEKGSRDVGPVEQPRGRCSWPSPP